MSTGQTIAGAAEALRRGRATSAALVEASLDAIARWQPKTNAFVLVDAEGARAAAIAADAERRDGRDRGPLHGIPISLKDLIDVAGQITTAGSNVLRQNRAAADAPIVTRLREAGAVFVGKTNLHEFALGTTSEDSGFGPVRNPLDETRSPGGSSGGSAAAVATGMGLGSIGTDTGGSIRIPAAACGIVGLKPSLGEVPTEGVIPLSTTLDHAGPIAASVADAAILWAALVGRPFAPAAPRSPSSLRLRRPGGYFAAPVMPAVNDAFDRAIDRCAASGVSVEPGSIEGTETITEIYVDIVLPEAAWWHAPYLDARADDYTPTVRSRILNGRDVPALRYLRALEGRRRLARAVDAALEGVDALVLPTLPIVAPPIGAAEVVVDPASNARMAPRAAMLKHTQLFNITGHPAISLPIPAGGLPVGLQLVGHRDRTADLLAVAAACEAILAA
jgi:aspartyl-tRNA(Asn)/glutamyl-tRNA(Gln) amidotransferase subunit A